MSKFGWSYPPGCSGPPEDDHSDCLVCGGNVYEEDPELGGCICEECPQCGAYGDPNCYDNHGMFLSIDQVHQRAIY